MVEELRQQIPLGVVLTLLLTVPGLGCAGKDDICILGCIDSADEGVTVVEADGGCDTVTWYRDADGDEYGSPDVSRESCDEPVGSYVQNDDDCDDGDPGVHPGASEVDDSEDNDCDGRVDEGVDGNNEGSDSLGFTGYYIVGKYDPDHGQWECINLYWAFGGTSENECDGCDFSLWITAEYDADALDGDYATCDWYDFEFWSEIDYFSTYWGFDYDPESYSDPVAYYYYYGYDAWYPASYLYYGYGYYGYSYLQWTFFVEYDSLGSIEAGLFYGYPYYY